MSRRYQKNKGFSIKKSPHLIQVNILLDKISYAEIDQLAKSKDIAIAGLLRELIELALFELQEQGQIVVGRKKKS